MTERRAVLITGVTGFLGSEIAVRLLRRDDRALLCLVRADSAAAAARSGHAALARALANDFGRRPAGSASTAGGGVAGVLTGDDGPRTQFVASMTTNSRGGSSWPFL